MNSIVILCFRLIYALISLSINLVIKYLPIINIGQEGMYSCNKYDIDRNTSS